MLIIIQLLENKIKIQKQSSEAVLLKVFPEKFSLIDKETFEADSHFW